MPTVILNSDNEHIEEALNELDRIFKPKKITFTKQDDKLKRILAGKDDVKGEPEGKGGKENESAQDRPDATNNASSSTK
ncbi:hypothetical protein N0V84_007177 [Fusarium piperis]|uniref:Uncharacterized protein n=1 Tax=Fusarium piperis TaxID=1435070 RepID=A0A9W8WAF3_9HYPO|nr:hypothetical protein N0V84_007177 [Fusarium piperis]